MMRPRNLIPLIVTTVLFACQDEVPSSPARSQADSPSMAVVVDTTWFVGESDFRAVSKVIPEFSGYYFDEAGRLVILLTDVGKLDAVSPLLRQLLDTRVIDQRRNLHGATVPIVAHRATYSFDQLRAWRDALIAAADRLPTIIRIDLDEVQNKVAIGVRRGSVHSTVLNGVTQLMIPAHAVVLEEVQSIVDAGAAASSGALVSFAPGDSLTSYNNVVKGGMRITWNRVACSLPGCGPGSELPGEKQCTFGLGVRYGSPVENGFLTNSHCSEQPGSVAAQTAYHQPFISGSVNLIGRESVDPPFISCAGGHSCRNSDALFALWDASAGSRSSFAKIARTTFFGTPYGSLSAVGSVVIDAANPEFTVIGEPGNPAVGEAADKMGHLDGWTGGPITKTCVTHIVALKNFNPPRDYRATCQAEASYNREQGESGAAVFKFLGTNNVLFMGLHMGAVSYNGGPYYAIFSPIHRIRADFPNGLITY